MLLLHFSHPLTAEQIAQLAALTGQPVARAISLPVQFDSDAPFEPQLRALMVDPPLTPEALQTEPIVVSLPSLNFSPNHRMPERVLK